MNAYACAPDNVCLQENVKKLQMRIVKAQHLRLLNWLKCESDEA